MSNNLSLDVLFPQEKMNEKFPVDVKNLHMWLEVETKWTTWFSRKVKKFSFVQGVDFVTSKNEFGDYTDARCTLNMAKELCMLSNSDRGREIRLYFIRCEEQLQAIRIAPPPPPQPLREVAPEFAVALSIVEGYKQLASYFKTPEHIYLMEASKYIEKKVGVAGLISPVSLNTMVNTSEIMDDIKELEMMLQPADLGKQLGISGQAVNKFLFSQGLQTKNGDGMWQPTEKGKPYCFIHSWGVRHRGGSHKEGYNLKWNLIKVSALYKKTEG